LQSEWADPEQLVPFAVLNEENQKKDLDIVRTAISVYIKRHQVQTNAAVKLQTHWRVKKQGRKEKSSHEDKDKKAPQVKNSLFGRMFTGRRKSNRFD
jgi:hypothetical protein